MRSTRLIPILTLVALTGIGVVLHRTSVIAPINYGRIWPSASVGTVELIKNPKAAADKIVNGAKLEVIDEVVYDAEYKNIPYPNGDVPADRGACTDVIIRALRNAGYDLQKLMHEDMTRHFSLYPKQWGLSAPDSNIDHRRVPNHLVFMRRFGKSLPLSTKGDSAKTWKPGDLVYWNYSDNRTHCGVVSNECNDNGLPLVIHNDGPTSSQDDCLNNWEIIGHFRYPKVPH